MRRINEHVKEISVILIDVKNTNEELKDVIKKMYVELIKKVNTIKNLELDKEALVEIAKKKAQHDVDKMDIQTTAEGKSALQGRYKYWYKKLKGGE